MKNNNIYNEIHKKLFLEQFQNQDTKDVYNRIFLKSFILESKYNTDLYDFAEEQFAEFIKNHLKPSTKESARTYCNILNSYVQWGIEKRYSKLYVNPLRRSQEYFYNFVQDKRLYVSYDEKEAILDSLVNDQDRFIIQALFEGIEGSKVSELVNIKVNDLKLKSKDTSYDYIDYIAVLTNNKGVTRILPIEAKTYYMGIGANTQKDYYKKNGEVDYSHNVKDTVALPESQYIIKSAKTNPDGEGKQVSHYTIYNRLEMIKNLEEFEEYTDALTTKNLVRSGMIYWAKKIMDRDKIEILERKHYEEICERFGIKYKWSLRDFINEDVIADLYG